MKSQLRAVVVVFLGLTILTGIASPLLVRLVAQGVFAHRANGSVMKHEGKPVGSELIGQPFEGPEYFWGRVSATSPAYNAAASTGSNYGPTNPSLVNKDIDPEKLKPGKIASLTESEVKSLGLVQKRIYELRKADPENTAPIPVDLVTASASGLDPHISPAAAEYQVARVARARKAQGMTEQRLRQLIAQYTEGRTFGVLGEPRVNVLRLNLALEGKSPGE
jgi:K+-transporting ATPase ATPase C chain